MKLCNFASLDPAHRARGVSGLGNVAAGDREVFEAFAADWEGLALESEAALERLGVAVGDVEDEVGAERGDIETEAVRPVKVRRVQALFRATVMASYDYTCAISGIAIPALLQASHIVPWSRDAGRRLDPRNGIALSALHDRAFDRGLITLDEELRVVVAGAVRVVSGARCQVFGEVGLRSFASLRMTSGGAAGDRGAAGAAAHAVCAGPDGAGVASGAGVCGIGARCEV
jgi:hypothetical protein